LTNPDTGLSVRTALGELRRRLRTVLGFQVLAGVLASLVLLPFGAWVLALLVKSTGTPAISNFELVSFFLSPTGLAALLLIAAIGVGVVLLQQAGFVILATTPEGGRFEATAALLRAVRVLPFLLRLAAIQIATAGIAAVPFALLGLASYSFWLGDHDINYYLAMRPTEFWIVLIVVLLLASGYGLVGVLLYLRWILAVPIRLLEGGSATAVLRASWSSVGGSVWRLARPMAGWWLLVLVAGGLGAMVFDFAEDVVLGLVGSSIGLVVPTVAGLLVMEMGVGLAVGFVASAVHFILLVQAYEMLRGRMPARQEVSRGAGHRPAKGRMVWAGAAALVIMTLGTCFWIVEQLEQERSILISAHRGSSLVAPENTLAAIRQAVTDGADFAEIDVQETADGVVVVVHDSDLKRITGIARQIWEVRYDEIAELDAGSWFSPEFAGERIPTLEQAIEVARGQIGLNIELKFNGHDQRLAERVVEIVEREAFGSDCLIMSLDYPGLQTVRGLNPGLEIGALVAQSVGDVTALDVDFVAFQASQVTRDIAGQLRSRGKKVHVWTVNEPAEMLRFVNIGVDGIITDAPAVLVRLLGEVEMLSPTERLLLAFRNRLGR
jgi:glycerophosphoryl diester phosphodiesterase